MQTTHITAYHKLLETTPRTGSLVRIKILTDRGMQKILLPVHISDGQVTVLYQKRRWLVDNEGLHVLEQGTYA